MTEYHYLLGAEDALRASHNMESAAESMRSAASHMDDAMARHRQEMSAMLDRPEQILTDHRHAPLVPTSAEGK